jgi:hypothetical protein
MLANRTGPCMAPHCTGQRAREYPRACWPARAARLGCRCVQLGAPVLSRAKAAANRGLSVPRPCQTFPAIGPCTACALHCITGFGGHSAQQPPPLEGGPFDAHCPLSRLQAPVPTPHTACACSARQPTHRGSASHCRVSWHACAPALCRSTCPGALLHGMSGLLRCAHPCWLPSTSPAQPESAALIASTTPPPTHPAPWQRRCYASPPPAAAAGQHARSWPALLGTRRRCAAAPSRLARAARSPQEVLRWHTSIRGAVSRHARASRPSRPRPPRGMGPPYHVPPSTTPRHLLASQPS